MAAFLALLMALTGLGSFSGGGPPGGPQSSEITSSGPPGAAASDGINGGGPPRTLNGVGSGPPGR